MSAPEQGMGSEPPQVKICGLTRPKDAETSFACGAAFGGVNGYPPSPRYVDPGRWKELLAAIPQGKRVWVAVEPTPDEARRALEAGFDLVQAHFDSSSAFNPEVFASAVGSEHIWLAPRLKDPMDFQTDWLPRANAFLIDAFSEKLYGGTGKQVRAEAFRSLAEKHVPATFVLAGGLNPENVTEAVRKSGAQWIDVGSGVEESPGCKSEARIRALFAALASK